MGKDPEFKRVEKAVQEWGGSETHSRKIRDGADAVLKGESPPPPARAKAKVLVETVNSTPVVAQTLHRGMYIKAKDKDAFKAATASGSKLDVPLASTSSDVKVARSFAKQRSTEQGSGGLRVMYTIEKSAGLRIGGLGYHSGENETLISGRYEVTNANMQGNVWNVTLSQTGRLKS